MNIYQVAKSFNLTLGEIYYQSGICNDFRRINDFKKGDVIACFAGHPFEVLCIVELVTDNVDVDNIEKCISKNSMMPLTCHLITAKWFKVN